MCEKIREGKVLSPPSDGDIDESYPKDWKPVKKTKKKKRSKKKKKICKTCSQDTISLKKRDSLRYNSKYDQKLAKEYCKEHEMSHSDHKCKPHWCGDCGYLIKYNIEIDYNKVDYDK